MGLVSQDFDLVLSIFDYVSNPSFNRLFLPKKPFKWDESFFVNEERFNNNLNVPTLWDPLTSGIPERFFQSGYGFGNNLELKDISQFKKLSKTKWLPKLNHGSFYSRRVPFYLYSDESIVKIAEEEFTTDGRTKINLCFPPKSGIPISVKTLRLDEDFNVTINNTFQSVSKFTGIVVNGVELDTEENISNIDPLVREFKVIYNPNYITQNFVIPTPLGPGEVTFQLDPIPLNDCGYALDFSRKDIFIKQKFLAAEYGEGVYGNFLYGTGVEDVGDYMINFSTGEVTVILDQEYVNLGSVSYINDYPAIIELNNNYVIDIGSSILGPTVDDLDSLVRGPQSDGLSNQIVPIGIFPIIDYTDERFLDTDNFHLFLFDAFNQTFETDWERVRNFDDSGPTDKHYILDADRGQVLFGDNEQGAIPQAFKFFFFGLKTSVNIEYEPSNSTDLWTDRTRDIHPLHNTLSSGFLYLSRKELVPVSLVVDFSVDEITALESAELRVTVLDREQEPVPNQLVNLEIVGSVGNLEDQFVITDENGQGFTNYLPSSKITEIGVYVQFYEPGPDINTPGDEINSFSSTNMTNDTITLEEPIFGNIEDIFLFKIYADTDPLQPYNHITRTGGLYIVHYEDTGPSNELIRPILAVNNVLVFDQSLPQPLDSGNPNYEPNLRGYAIISKRRISVQGSLDFKNSTIFSNIETLLVSYSEIQQGDWTLPIPPTTFTSSEIDRAIFLTIN